MRGQPTPPLMRVWSVMPARGSGRFVAVVRSIDKFVAYPSWFPGPTSSGPEPNGMLSTPSLDGQRKLPISRYRAQRLPDSGELATGIFSFSAIGPHQSASAIGPPIGRLGLKNVGMSVHE